MDKRDTLLLTCGTTESRGTMRELMADSFNLLEADNTYQAVQLLEQNSGCVAAMLVDVTAPEKIDREVFAQAGKRGLWKQIPVIVIARESTARLFSLAFSLGVADVVPLNGDPHIIRRRIHNIVELYLYRQKLEDMLLEQAETIHQTNQRMVDALSSIIEHRSAESGQHILRIRRFTQLLLQEVARSCPEYELTEQTIRMISSAAALHDVGKISVPDAILNKPGRLTEEEREIMKTHAALGCEILESLNDVGNHEYLRYAHNICHYHHERWDGKGYPEGIAGDDIPICAQVVGLADVYDALTSERIYKAAYSCDTAVNMILSGECGVFSPKLLECFKQVSGQFEELARAYADGALPTAERFDVELPQPAAADGANSLEAVQTKYFALLHYMNAFVAEVDFDQNYHHLIYNPYPELSALRDAVGFEEVKRQGSHRWHFSRCCR